MQVMQKVAEAGVELDAPADFCFPAGPCPKVRRLSACRLIQAAKRSERLKRAAIKLTGAGRLAKKLMYASTTKTLTDAIQKINQRYLKERQEIYERCKRRAWADWLRAQAIEGDQQALAALRARDGARGLKGNTVSGMGRRQSAQVSAEPDGITKHGTIIYRVGPTAVRDDGSRLSVSRGVTPEGLQAALRLAMQRYGNSIAVGGSAAFKQQIAEAAAAAHLPLTFEDPALERRRQQLLHIDLPSTQQERHQGAESDQAPRRGVDRPAGLMPAQAVVNALSAEGPAKSPSGLDPAQRMRSPVDAPVDVTAKGVIKRRGRSR